MSQRLAHISLLVKDYDEAIQFYTQSLDFILIEDTQLTPEKRWVLVAPPGPWGCTILLAKATNDGQASAIGKQAGRRVFLYLPPLARMPGEPSASIQRVGATPPARGGKQNISII